MTKMLTLCKTGWELYDEWIERFDVESQLRYLRHRHYCRDCRLWMDNGDIEEEEMMTAAPKRSDRNQAEIISALREAGCQVIDMHVVGHNFPDLLIVSHGIIGLIEVKTEDGKLSPGQMKFLREFRGPVTVCRTVDDAIEWAAQLGDPNYREMEY